MVQGSWGPGPGPGVRGVECGWGWEELRDLRQYQSFGSSITAFRNSDNYDNQTSPLWTVSRFSTFEKWKVSSTSAESIRKMRPIPPLHSKQTMYRSLMGVKDSRAWPLGKLSGHKFPLSEAPMIFHWLGGRGLFIGVSSSAPYGCHFIHFFGQRCTSTTGDQLPNN